MKPDRYIQLIPLTLFSGWKKTSIFLTWMYHFPLHFFNLNLYRPVKNRSPGLGRAARKGTNYEMRSPWCWSAPSGLRGGGWGKTSRDSNQGYPPASLTGPFEKEKWASPCQGHRGCAAIGSEVNNIRFQRANNNSPNWVDSLTHLKCRI